jgi:hypothetical protein
MRLFLDEAGNTGGIIDKNEKLICNDLLSSTN